MMEWKDTTSYSRGGDRSPQTYTARVGKLRLVVTRHRDYPGRWVADCPPFMRLHVLRSGTADEAKREALDILKIHIEDILADVEQI